MQSQSRREETDMNKDTGPVIRQSLSKASVIGAVMAMGGIVLFVVLYGVLGNMGIQASMRILIALCIPPAIMALLIGGYFLLFRPKTPLPPQTSETPNQPE
jgi:hypothetical protein